MFHWSVQQVTVREVDQGYIYGNFTCRAKNQQGVGTIDIEMRRASESPFCSYCYRKTPNKRLVDSFITTAQHFPTGCPFCFGLANPDRIYETYSFWVLALVKPGFA